MNKSELLQEAIADARAVRETALQNAKAVLEEAFTPKLQSMLATRLRENLDEEGDEDMETLEEFESVEEDGGSVMAEGESGYKASDHTVDPQGASKELSAGPTDQDTKSTKTTNTSSEGPKAGGKLTPSKTDKSDVGPGKHVVTSDQDTDLTTTDNTDNELTISEGNDELSAIIAELEAEVGCGNDDELGLDLDDESPVGEEPVGDDTLGLGDDIGGEAPVGEEPVDDLDLDNGEESALKGRVDGVTGEEGGEFDEIDLDEILREMELGEEFDAGDMGGKDYSKEVTALQEEVAKLRTENAEYKKAFSYVKGQLNEVNLLNSKLLYVNKVFKSFGLTNEQKQRIVEAFDRTKTVREVKLTYANLCESFQIANTTSKKSSLTESIASKAIKSTKPSAKTQEKQKQILSEGNELASRFQKLAGIKK